MDGKGIGANAFAMVALANGSLRLGPDSEWRSARAELAALPGFGPWTVESVMMRALGDPDAFPATDLGVRKAAGRASKSRRDVASKSTTGTPAAASWRLASTLSMAIALAVTPHPT